jgi:hypothetical protein
MSGESSNAGVQRAVDTIPTQQTLDGVLQCRLDAVEVLQMTLEDVKSHKSEDDVSTVLERVEMCCRFLESTPWSDENGIIENIGLKLIEIHMNLSNGKRIGSDFLGAKDWEDLETILTSMNSQEDALRPSGKLLTRDYRILKLMIIDRIVALLISGPLEFSNPSSFQLLDRIDICRRCLEDDDLDLPALKIVSDDILCLVNLIDCYEVMEFWETIDFKNWVIRSMKTALHGFSNKVKVRKVYSSADIEEEKLTLIKQCRTILVTKPADFSPPVMMKRYPIHPYLTNLKKHQNRSVVQQNGKIRMKLVSKSVKCDRTKLRDDVLDQIDTLIIDESNVNLSKTHEDQGDIDCAEITALQPPKVNDDNQDYTIPSFSQLNSKPTYQQENIPAVDGTLGDDSDLVVSVLSSGRKLASNETLAQEKDFRIGMEVTATNHNVLPLLSSDSPLPSLTSHFIETNSVLDSPSILPLLSSGSLLPPPPLLPDPGSVPSPPTPYPSPTTPLPAPLPYPDPVSFSSTHILGSSWPVATASLLSTPSAPSHRAPVIPHLAPLSLSVPLSLPPSSACLVPMSNPAHSVSASSFALSPPLLVYDYSSLYRQFPHC